MEETHNADALLNIIRSRRSHRRFSDKPVSEEMVDKIIEGARYAPSSCNMQLLGLIRVNDKTIRERMVKEGKAHGTVVAAPVVFLVTYDRELSQDYDSNIQSGSAAAQNMMLVATSLGLGCFWAATVGKEHVIRSILNIPERRAILALAMFGWPKEDLVAPRRKEPEEFVHINQYDPSRDITLSGDPNKWDFGQLKTFQELRLRSGSKYMPYLQEEYQSILELVIAHTPQKPRTWLDMLPATGAYTEGLTKRFADTSFTIADIAAQMMLFSAGRCEGKVTTELYNFEGLSGKTYDVVSCLFRLEAYPKDIQKKILNDITRAVKPNGTLVIGVVSSHSYFLPFYNFKKALKKEFRFPTMTPNMLAPFLPIDQNSVIETVRAKGYTLKQHDALFLLPTSEEVSTFYSANKTWKKPLLDALSYMLRILPRVWREKHSKVHLLFFEK